MTEPNTRTMLNPPTNRDTARILVLHHPDSPQAPAIALDIVRHFEGTAVIPQAQPVSTRVFSQFDSHSDASHQGRLFNFGAATFTVVVLLVDHQLHDALAEPWAGLRRTIVDAIPPHTGSAPDSFCLPLVIAMDKGALDPLRTGQAFPDDGPIQAELACDWPGGVATEHGTLRILLHISRLILDGLQRVQPGASPPPAQRSAFLSHAKADLPEHRADSLVHELAARMDGTNYGLEAYLDEIDALPGWSWRRQFRTAIEDGTLIAFDGDAYPSRPECQRELLRAKRSRRPILAIDRRSTSPSHELRLRW